MIEKKTVRLGDFKPTFEQKMVINEILASGKITEGRYVGMFEREVERFLKVKHAIATTNGTVSLQLIGQYLQYVRNKKDLVVCVPATTFPATLNAFEIIGCKIILCDVSDDLCININTLTEEEKQSIDVMVPVALLGYTPNMELIMSEAEKYNWVVVEDFAEAFGSRYKTSMIGSIGHFGSCSFYMSHVVQAGELGVVTTNDDEAAAVLRKMKMHGRTGDPLLFEHSYIGSNYKTTEFCAAIGYLQLKIAKTIIEKRQKNVEFITGFVKNKYLKLFPYDNNCSYLGYPMLASSKDHKEKFCRYLNKVGIETRGMFPCLANQQAYKHLQFDASKYPVSVMLEELGFYVGVHQYITDEELIWLIRGLNEEL
jgi:dTDP-4-amino-4,6-dideoxygalactose transaminase